MCLFLAGLKAEGNAIGGGRKEVYFVENLENAPGDKARSSGRLRLALPLTFGVRYITPVGQVGDRQSALDAVYSDRNVDLLNEGFDAPVRLGYLKDTTLVSRPIAPLRGVIVAGQGYLSRHGTPASPTDLLEHDGTLYRPLAQRPDERRRVALHAGSGS